jgi:hypothetical protein
MAIPTSRTDRAIAFGSLWVARLSLSVLAFAGMMYLLGGIDHTIAYPVSVVAVALLVKETL